jgi:hypothetical protein
MIALFAIIAILASAQAQCPSSGFLVGARCWYTTFFLAPPADCDSKCAIVGGIADADEIINVVGSGGTDAACQVITDAFGFQATVEVTTSCSGQGLGCFFTQGQSLRCTFPTTTTAATITNPTGIFVAAGRYCACDVAISSGFTDPHFSGFNGEQLDIKHDDAASNKYFNIFCQENVAINALFSPNAEELLYMTEFNAKFGSFQFEMTLEKFVASGDFEIVENGKYKFENGNAVATASDVIVKYGAFTFHFVSVTEGSETYLDVYVQGPRKGQVADGIVGRSLTRAHSSEEFSQYMQFIRSEKSDFTCQL